MLFKKIFLNYQQQNKNSGAKVMHFLYIYKLKKSKNEHNIVRSFKNTLKKKRQIDMKTC